MVGDIKHIVIIESLENERLTGQEIYNDCIKRQALVHEGRTHAFHSVSTKNQFVEILKYYQECAPYIPGGLLIHFEMHGSKDLDGLILSNNSLVEWEELVDNLRPINISTSNNLFITMATCYGRYLYKGADPYKKSAYSGFISASQAVFPSQIVDKFSILFEKLFICKNLVAAYLEMENVGSDFYYKDSETSFEEAFKFTTQEINQNPEKEAELINEYKEKMIKMGYKLPSDNEWKKISDIVLKDLYESQKKAFEF